MYLSVSRHFNVWFRGIWIALTCLQFLLIECVKSHANHPILRCQFSVHDMLYSRISFMHFKIFVLPSKLVSLAYRAYVFLVGDLSSFGVDFFDGFDAVIVSRCSLTSKVKLSTLQCQFRMVFLETILLSFLIVYLLFFFC